MSDLPLSDQEISAFFALLEERVGVRLDLSKKYLLFARLQAFSLEANYPSVGDFVRFLNRSRHTSWHDAAFAALTTNETMFSGIPPFFGHCKPACFLHSFGCAPVKKDFEFGLPLHLVVRKRTAWP